MKKVALQFVTVKLIFISHFNLHQKETTHNIIITFLELFKNQY
jgi:hypothetical protein